MVLLSSLHTKNMTKPYLQSLVEYIVHFANELFEEDSARCRLDLPPDLPACSLPPEMRHNIFLVVKEALTNALKHSHAREVRVQARATARAETNHDDPALRCQQEDSELYDPFLQ